MKRLLLISLIITLWTGISSPGKSQVPKDTKDLSMYMDPVTKSRVEKLFSRGAELIDAHRLKQTHQQLTERPHVAGTPGGEYVVRYLAQAFQRAGLKVHVDGYRVLLSYPRSISLKLVEPVEESFDLLEKGLDLDKDAYDSQMFMPFNGYSGSGQVTGQVVYANYGREEDYEYLKKQGISVEGHIVLARYGAIFRGVKAMLAEKNGAKALILYSDPRDDGYHRGDVYPHGPWRPSWAVQRGSVMWMTIYPGDPLTPGFASPAPRPLPETPTTPLPFTAESNQRAKPSTAEEAENLPHIPVMPISYGNAVKILEKMGGPVAPLAWQGGLPVTYHLGPGPAKVHLQVEMEQPIRPIFNVIGWIPGKTDDVIILGNHHDAWTYGAVDPSSGTTVIVEIARVLGQLAGEGFRPQRTIVLATWDGEEYGLLGSTEFVERYQTALKDRLMAYINCDSAVSGKNPGAAAVPHLRRWLEWAASWVPHPTRPGSLLDIWRKGLETAGGKRPEIGYLGSGSDYTAFLDHAGLPAMSLGLSGAYGVYHANIDDHFWMTHFTDPDFVWHRMAARWLLAILLIGSESERYPFDPVDYATVLKEEFKKLENDVLSLKDDSIKKAYQRVSVRIREWGHQVSTMDKVVQQAVKEKKWDIVNRWNQWARGIDQQFIDREGLPGRPWFRHLIFAPGLDLGYGARIFPGIKESLKSGNREVIKQQLDALGTAFDRLIAWTRRFENLD